MGGSWECFECCFLFGLGVRGGVAFAYHDEKHWEFFNTGIPILQLVNTTTTRFFNGSNTSYTKQTGHDASENSMAQWVMLQVVNPKE